MLMQVFDRSAREHRTHFPITIRLAGTKHMGTDTHDGGVEAPIAGGRGKEAPPTVKASAAMDTVESECAGI